MTVQDIETTLAGIEARRAKHARIVRKLQEPVEAFERLSQDEAAQRAGCRYRVDAFAFMAWAVNVAGGGSLQAPAGSERNEDASSMVEKVGANRTANFYPGRNWPYPRAPDHDQSGSNIHGE